MGCTDVATPPPRGQRPLQSANRVIIGISEPPLKCQQLLVDEVGALFCSRIRKLILTEKKYISIQRHKDVKSHGRNTTLKTQKDISSRITMVETQENVSLSSEQILNNQRMLIIPQSTRKFERENFICSSKNAAVEMT